jgi:hypothetical protein
MITPKKYSWIRGIVSRDNLKKYLGFRGFRFLGFRFLLDRQK